MTRCAVRSCRTMIPNAEPGQGAMCGPCSDAICQKLLLDPCEDPTALQCKNCQSFYPLNSPRVRRAIETQAGDQETPELCWVCTRLHYAAQQEAAS